MAFFVVVAVLFKRHCVTLADRRSMARHRCSVLATAAVFSIVLLAAKADDNAKSEKQEVPEGLNGKSQESERKSIYTKSAELPLYWQNASSLPSLSSSNCHLRPKDTRLHHYVRELLDRQSKLIEYDFLMDKYDYNPIMVGNKWSYKAHLWSRVASSHGQTILNLAFNYGILSLQTLSFGVEKLSVVLQVIVAPITSKP